MSGERNLSQLLKGLSPALSNKVYVFATVPLGTNLSDIPSLMQFTEEEGLTLILEREVARNASFQFEFPCRKITLKVHSALDAVGMMATASGALAQNNIPVNPVAGFYHDHLFVPEDQSENAIRVLQALHTSSS